MKNSLTLEERAQISSNFDRFMGHDVKNIGAILQSQIELGASGSDWTYGPEKILKFWNHYNAFINSLSYLFKDESYLQRADPSWLEDKMEDMNEAFAKLKKPPIVHYDSFGKSFSTFPPVLYTAMYHLAYNSSRFVNPQGEINVTMSGFSGHVDRALYSPDDGSERDDFVVLTVRDNGQGFPQDILLDSLLKFNLTKEKSGGFGLPYVALACKLLRSHLTIESSPGNTRVSIYHPLNLKD
ncbi:MAG: ATP-binding protein [Nanoarchaeota archaeon]